MQKIPFHTQFTKHNADYITPIQIYSALRTQAPNTLLLESSDYNNIQNAFSYIAFLPAASFIYKDDLLTLTFPSGEVKNMTVKNKSEVIHYLQEFATSFQGQNTIEKGVLSNGLLGAFSYDSIECFEDLSIEKKGTFGLPTIQFYVYKYIISIDHFHEQAYLISHQYENERTELSDIRYLSAVSEVFQPKTFTSLPFQTLGEETSNMSDDDYLKMVEKGIQHCYRGDVFQIVLSRRFQQRFTGDPFQVYRALRSINPSPYLFYFDFTTHSLFGSSPESQLKIKDGKATLFPIAGTFKKTGNPEFDKKQAAALIKDPKENAEHLMLVDLARNDLSRFGRHTQVEKFKEIQYFSHVIHLVSEVSAQVSQKDSFQLMASTFPAGTLSGAPKYRAMQLIDEYEPNSRNYYAGSAGFLGFDLEVNQAIVIRSFLAHRQVLYFQAGAGIVSQSVPEKELEEVNNKLRSLRVAIQKAKGGN